MKRVDVAGRGDDGAVPVRLLLADGALPVVRDGPRGDALEADHGHALDDACAQQRKLSEGGGGEAGRGRGGAGPGRRDRGGGEGLVEEPPAYRSTGLAHGYNTCAVRGVARGDKHHGRSPPSALLPARLPDRILRIQQQALRRR